MNRLDASDWFARRHIGPSPDDRDRMLETVGAASLDALVDEAIPASIRLARPLNLPPAESEHGYLRRLTAVARRNKTFRSYIGLGYHDTITPSVILRMVMENPGWYTPYTPYQAEIAQGRLESLLNFQTMVADLTGMEVATASLLDEATAAAEAMTLLHRARTNRPGNGERSLFLVSDRCLPQTIDVLRTRAEPLDIDLHVGPVEAMKFEARVFGVVLEYPDQYGAVMDLEPFIANAHDAGVLVAVGTDLLALALLKPPGEMGADVVYGNSQRFGVPLGYGGPHAAFFATRHAFVRQAPGRIIGVSVDAHGHKAYRMALATREQHIRREKATSNICTAQALLANMAAMYGVYHGPEGLKAIAGRVHELTRILDRELTALGARQTNAAYFDTLRLDVPSGVDPIRRAALEAGINFRYIDSTTIGVALNETVTTSDVQDIVNVFARGLGASQRTIDWTDSGSRIPDPGPRRTSAFMTHPVFNTHRSETQMMRYIRALERKDIG
ncbi:MAG TPA: hypothetical protein VKC35_08160, partial [Vicinamibacterales bacterium]|nr:hypothetical protein [Vicinamibacterales bacterium]